MCGIAGVIAWDDRYRTSRDTLARMSAAIAHRGPDGEGMWFNHEGEVTPDRPQAAFAHRRLAIIDPDPRANQPFTDGRGRWITYNGEIYNYRALRKELESLQSDYAWRTNCDTEVLLVAYATWGEKCVEHLNGMFAFAVWDDTEKTLFLARDRMGQKPLYVALGDGGLAFASEVGALRPLPWIKWDVWNDGLVRYLRLGCTDRFFEGCFQHPPGFTRTERGGGDGGTLRKYFDPETPSPESTLHPRRDARSLTLAAVARQLVSDVPLGAFLSGGVDSSVIAAAARQQGPLKTFSIGFDDPRYDESEHAAAVARHLGTEHHVFHVRPDAAADLPKLARAFGEPFADSSALPTHYLSRETRQHVKVALSGDGGDELFGGYDRYRALALSRRLRTWTTPIPWIAVSKMMSSPPGGHPKSMVTRAKRFIASVGRPEVERYPEYLRIFSARQIDELTAYDAGLNKHFDLVACHFVTWCCTDPVRYAMFTDRETYLPMDLLAKVDRVPRVPPSCQLCARGGREDLLPRMVRFQR